MSWQSRKHLTLLVCLSVWLTASNGTPRQAARSFPSPTEGAEEANEAGRRRAREIWDELRHRTSSWREIESENRLQNLEARAEMLLEGRAGAPGHWTERGSFDQTGRTHVTAVGSDGTTLFIGTDKGGVFSGAPGGRQWRPRSDGLGIGVQSFVIVPGKQETWIAADETGPLYVTRNQGLTWDPAPGGPGGQRVVRLLRDPEQPQAVYALATGNREAKLYRSLDGDIRFAAVFTLKSAVSDLWMSRTTSGPLYLVDRQDVLISKDRGKTFQQIGKLPVPVEEVVLAGSEAGAPTLYAALRGPKQSAWQLFISENAGGTWKAGDTLTDFWPALTASITDPRLVFAGGVHAHRSTDGGLSFQPLSDWKDYYANPTARLHADLPGIDCVIYHGKEVFFFNTDGGTFLSEDGGKTVRNITQHGLGNGQYYKVLTSTSNPDLIAAGAQDQGYQVSRPGSGTMLGFDQLEKGDYGSLTSSDGTHNRLYSAFPGYPGGILVQLREGSRKTDQLLFPVLPDERRHPWIPALVADPDDPDTLYFADRKIWRMKRQGGGGKALPHDFGAGSDADYVTAFAISPADRKRWYAGTAKGRLWSSSNRGETWVTRTKIASLVVTDVLPSPTDPNVCYVTGSGYDGAPVHRTTNGGASWQPFSQGLPRTMGEALAFGDPVRQDLYAATEAGPFRYDKASRRWISLLGTGAPLTHYMDVEGVPAAGIVRFATYGRGIWDYDPSPQSSRSSRP